MCVCECGTWGVRVWEHESTTHEHEPHENSDKRNSQQLHFHKGQEEHDTRHTTSTKARARQRQRQCKLQIGKLL